MITTTIDSLLTIKPILQKLANTTMSAKEAFQVLKMLKLVDKEYESIEIVQKQMLEKYGDKNEDDCFNLDEKGNVVIKKDLINDYIKEAQTFLKEKVELNCSKIPSNILDKIEFTPAQLLMIEDFIE